MRGCRWELEKLVNYLCSKLYFLNCFQKWGCVDPVSGGNKRTNLGLWPFYLLISSKQAGTNQTRTKK